MILEGKIIRAGREEAGYTQAEVASKLKYKTPQFISNLERGIAKLPKKKLKALARLIGARPVNKIIDVRVAAFRARLNKELE